jgi:hypothetical protein
VQDTIHLYYYAWLIEKGIAGNDGVVTFQDAVVRPLRSPIQHLASFFHAAQMTLRDNGFPLVASCGCTAILPKLDGVRHSSLVGILTTLRRCKTSCMTSPVAYQHCLRALPDRRHRSKGMLTSGLALACHVFACTRLFCWTTDGALSLCCAEFIG